MKYTCRSCCVIFNGNKCSNCGSTDNVEPIVIQVQNSGGKNESNTKIE